MLKASTVTMHGELIGSEFTEPECIKHRLFNSRKVEIILERWEGRQGSKERWKSPSTFHQGVERKRREEKTAERITATYTNKGSSS